MDWYDAVEVLEHLDQVEPTQCGAVGHSCCWKLEH